ncbi:hypothetical protein F5B20DRAFT_84729 [Whalleya microplaca]|nr:hypothetical protein F5B20DRAFT_84729 [Whalleya microplaca]
MVSTPTKSEANSAKVQLNAREMEIVAKAWQCIKEIKDGVVKVDCKKLAEIGPYASADSARHIWMPIQKKLLASAGVGAPSSSAPPTPSKAKGTPRKRKADANGSELADGLTPKKLRARKTKNLAKVELDEEEDDDLDIKSEEFLEGEV